MITCFVVTAVGAALGLRFKAFVLVPAIAVSSLGALAIGIGSGDSIWSSLLGMLSVVTALQIGYIAGTFLLFGVMRAQAHKPVPNIVAHRAKILS